jgi:HTH-type transcriptional regulator/antitoxin HigA
MEDKVPKMPGDVIRTELGLRGWTQSDLAKIVGRPLPTMNEIIVGKRGIMPEMAIALGAAFGNGAEFWAKLEADYRLALVPHDDTDIKRRVRMYEMVPVKDIEKRGWIRPGLNDEALESELCKFFGITSIHEEPGFLVAARKSVRASPLNAIQRAWCFRAKRLAGGVQSKPFLPSKLDAAERRLRQLAAYPKEARHVPETMRECGIRFVVVEPLPGGKIDGAAFWLDSDTPVIALSLRHDRIDSFWFTLMHEFAHIRAGDALSVDCDLSGDDFTPSELKEDVERQADERASASLIPSAEISSFVRRVGPMYSKDRIIQFAHRMKIHPGIIVGQLQHRKEIGFSANREMLAKVRDAVIDTALTDGFGRSVSPELI